MADLVVPHLVGLDGEVIELSGEKIRLGRAPDNQVVLNSDKCSRYHAVISFSKQGYAIRDLGSKNKTLVNDKIIETEYNLVSGDLITIGSYHFRFEDPAPTRTEEALGRKNGKVVTGLMLDINTQRVQRNFDEHSLVISLEGFQWRLLLLLYQNQGKICSRDQIVEAVYRASNEHEIPFDAAIDALVSRLRRKLFIDNPQKLPYIRAVRGNGYILEL